MSLCLLKKYDMDMTDSVAFTTLSSRPGGCLGEQLHELKVALRSWMTEKGLTPADLLQTRVYLTDAANQWKELRSHPLYACYLSLGAVSYVEQPLLDGSKVALQLWFCTRPGLKKRGTPECMTAEWDDVKLLFHSVRFDASEVRGLAAEEQTRLAFERHCALLAERGLTLEANCHRTWIYVRDIDRHYAGVVAGRNAFFAWQGLTPQTHYIASTGIEGYPDNAEVVVSMDFLSVYGQGVGLIKYLHAPDYLNPTHEYGVAFERGTAVGLPMGRFLFISGTASIDRHGECLYRGDVSAQTERLFLNIEKLLQDGSAALSDLRYMIIYLRDVADRETVCRYMEKHFPDTPYLLTAARVCRPEWLIEVEGIAVVPET